MPEQQIHAVTGAYGYSGKYIAKRLLKKGQRVITITNSLQRKNPFGKKVQAYPFNFDNPEGTNIIIGQTHFIKTVEDLYEAMAGTAPNARFGIAFCEASCDCLVRKEDNDEEM